MATILIDHNIEGQAMMLWRMLRKDGWSELVPLEFVILTEAGLRETTRIWFGKDGPILMRKLLSLINPIPVVSRTTRIWFGKDGPILMGKLLSSLNPIPVVSRTTRIWFGKDGPILMRKLLSLINPIPVVSRVGLKFSIC